MRLVIICRNNLQLILFAPNAQMDQPFSPLIDFVMLLISVSMINEQLIKHYSILHLANVKKAAVRSAVIRMQV